MGNGLEDQRLPADVHVWMAKLGLALIMLVGLEVLFEGAFEYVSLRTHPGVAQTAPTFGSAFSQLLVGVALVSIYRNGTYFSRREVLLRLAALLAVGIATTLLASYVVLAVDPIVHILPRGLSQHVAPRSAADFFEGLDRLPMAGMALMTLLAGAVLFLSGKPRSVRLMVLSVLAGLAVYVVLVAALQAGAGPAVP